MGKHKAFPLIKAYRTAIVLHPHANEKYNLDLNLEDYDAEFLSAPASINRTRVSGAGVFALPYRPSPPDSATSKWTTAWRSHSSPRRCLAKCHRRIQYLRFRRSHLSLLYRSCVLFVEQPIQCVHLFDALVRGRAFVIKRDQDLRIIVPDRAQ